MSAEPSCPPEDDGPLDAGNLWPVDDDRRFDDAYGAGDSPVDIGDAR